MALLNQKFFFIKSKKKKESFMLFLIEATFAFVDVQKTKTAFWLDIPPLVKQ
jgi:hypothetical protein